MKIGRLLKERMETFGLNVSSLACISFVDEQIIENLLEESMDIEEMDPFERELLCNALYCKQDFFTDKVSRDKDLIVASLNRGSRDTPKSAITKGKIQDFLSDYTFIQQILNEIQ